MVRWLAAVLAVCVIVCVIVCAVALFAVQWGDGRSADVAVDKLALDVPWHIDELASVVGESHREVAPVSGPDVSSAPARSGVGHGDAVTVRVVDAVTVRVVDAVSRAPITGALVDLQRNLMFDPAALHATVGANGTAHFDDVEAREWIVSASAAGRMDARSSAFVSAERPDAVITLELEARHELVVRLVDAADRPLDAERAGLDASARSHLVLALTRICGAPGFVSEAPSTRIFRTTILEDIDGAIAWRVVAEGRQPACVQASLGSVIVGAQTLDPDASELRLVVDADAVRVVLSPLVVRVLVGGTDEPLAGARVGAHQPGPRALVRHTDVDGYARFGEPVFGDALLLVEAAGFATRSIPVQQPFVDEQTVCMVPGHRASGRTLDQNGDPMPRARVALYSGSAADATPPRYADVLTSGAHAEFAFEGLAPGTYTLVVQDDADRVFSPNGLTRAPDAPGPGAAVVDVRFGDAAEVVLRGRRTVQPLDGEPWNPEPPPRR